MSRHADVDKVNSCAPSVSITVDWSMFYSTLKGTDDSSPLDAFYKAHQGLTKLASLVGSSQVDPDVQGLLGGQLLLGYVSATELYLRQAIAVSVNLCPIIRKANRDQVIRFGALDYYDKRALAAALTERVSFSEPGTIRTQLKQRLRVEVEPRSSISRSISDYETLCQLRHALVHSHGVINSANAGQLSGGAVIKSARANIDTQCLQWVAGICMNLARDVNTEVVRTIVWSWVCDGILTGDQRSDRYRISKLSKTLGSEQDRVDGRLVTSESDLRLLVRRIVADYSGS